VASVVVDLRTTVLGYIKVLPELLKG
jgi:hypothetical protein